MMYVPKAPPMKSVIQFEGVSFLRGKRQLFEDLTINLGDSTRGSVTALVGISGIGKSTFLRMVARLEKPASGCINVSGDTTSISFLSQDPVIFEHLSARDNARYLLQARGQAPGCQFKRLVADLRLEKILENRTAVSVLSGGERQRLAILRALSIEPTILLLDEPCAGLDPALRGSVIDGLQRAISSTSMTVLYVTHHIDEIVLSSDSVLFFEAPRTESGAVKLILRAAKDFLAQPPTLDSAMFALFPRCNVVKGHVCRDQFVAKRRDDSNFESIAFLPTQAQLTKGSSEPAMGSWTAWRRGGIVWLDVAGELIAVNAESCESSSTCSTLRVLPGALVYDDCGIFQRVLDKSLDIVNV